MNMNLNLNLKLNPQAILAFVKAAKVYLVGGALIAVFGYTAFIVNQALNVGPAATPSKPAPAKIVFDKATLTLIKQLEVVPGTVTPGAVGKSDPFGN